MGIRFSHGDHSMSCGGFNDFRAALATAAGIPLRLMEGWFRPGSFWPIDGAVASLKDPKDRAEAWGRVTDLCHGLCRRHGQPLEPPIDWAMLRNQGDPLYPLLTASDDDGRIPSGQTGALADRMAGLRETFVTGGGSWMRESFDRILAGLREAHAKGEAFEW